MADFDLDKQANREEPLIKDNNRQLGCINYYDLKQQDQEIDRVIKK